MATVQELQNGVYEQDVESDYGVLENSFPTPSPAAFERRVDSIVEQYV